MPARKTHDLAVKTGEYTNQYGETKGRWQNVGSLMRADDGGVFIILDRTFNPAGVVNPENRDSVMLSCFEPKERQQQRSAPVPSDDPFDDGDSIPF